MLKQIHSRLKTISAVLVIVTISGAATLHAQSGNPSGRSSPDLSPELQKSLDDAISHLTGRLEAHNEKMRSIEQRLFESPEKILRLCRSPMRPKNFRAVLNHFKATRGDPVSLPTMDCLFIESAGGGARLWSYKPAEDNSYYMLRAHEGMTPRGAFVFARHPLNFIHRRVLNGPDWVITRSDFAPLDAFPLKSDSKLTLTEQEGKKQPENITAKVVKSFPIIDTVDGQSSEVETLHIVVKDLGSRLLLGKLRRLRRWYIYSAKANVFIERSHALTKEDSENSAATGVDVELSSLSYIKDNQYVLKVSNLDLAPLRNYLKDFDVWAVD
ncbi:MAG: hypothetical protein K0U74_15110 [Alphaproteobacteria bacterium]|nr:hypothetical protein [Alphaproteobacteria bacterium]